jgi:exonuclease VII small subunit
MYGTEMEALAAVETSEQCLPEPALTQLALEMFRLYVVPQPLYTPRDVEMEKAQRLVKRLVAKGFKVRVETFLPKSPLVEEKKKKRTSQQVEKAMRRMQYSTQKLEMGISSLEFSIRSLEKLEPNLSDTQKQTLEQVKKLQATYVETILLTDKIE